MDGGESGPRLAGASVAVRCRGDLHEPGGRPDDEQVAAHGNRGPDHAALLIGLVVSSRVARAASSSAKASVSAATGRRPWRSSPRLASRPSTISFHESVRHLPSIPLHRQNQTRARSLEREAADARPAFSALLHGRLVLRPRHLEPDDPA